jgi:hypothetical protein
LLPRVPSFKLVGVTALILLAALSAFAQHVVTLAWDASPDTNVVGYSIYYGLQYGNYPYRIDAGTNLALTVANLPDGTFYFSATSRDSQGVESDFANVVSTNLFLQPDGVPPIVATTWPKANVTLLNSRKYTNGTFIALAPEVPMSGSAADANSITNLTVSRIVPPWAPLDFTPSLTGSVTNKQWTNIVKLVDGTNMFRIVATDGTGMTNVLLRTIYLKTTSRLTVLTNGFGSPVITGAAKNGALLDIGRNYSIKAAAKPNNWFVNWTDGSGNILSTNAALVFRMTNGLVLTANFVTNSIYANHLAGAYNGLFNEDSGASIRSAGSISNFVVGNTRTFSGKLYVAGASYLISGSLNPLGAVTKTILRGAKPNLDVSLQMEFASGTRQIKGIVSCQSEGWTSRLRADQAFYNSATHNPMASRYTMAIPPLNTSDTNFPVGYGYGLITNSVTGLASMTGALADMTQIKFASPISKNGDWPVCIDLYSHQGLLHGWINFSNGTPTGRLTWLKPEQSTATNMTSKTFAAGVNNSVEIIGSPYRAISPVLAFDSNALDLNTAIDSATFSISVTNNTSITSPTHISGSVATTTGLISLSLPATVAGGVPRAAYAVVLQNTNAAVGMVSGANAAVYLH